jgi:hypothetical protein
MRATQACRNIGWHSSYTAEIPRGLRWQRKIADPALPGRGDGGARHIRERAVIEEW